MVDAAMWMACKEIVSANEVIFIQTMMVAIFLGNAGDQDCTFRCHAKSCTGLRIRRLCLRMLV